ncbi:hypothetical protein F5Y13DRAFT_189311 [Hypoxylon sp. FL1857]|nr:hypothetical protein F5Y13DRAFT_189311 [Hypoxylon sp. FL1857]
MFSLLKFASLALVAAPVVLGSELYIQNNCGFTMYCGAAKNDGTSSSSVQVGNGGTYHSPLPANNDNIGSVLKCATNSGLQQPFQMELAVQNGRAWLDLSALDGDPFVGYHRHAELAGQCVLDCPGGATACEWPIQADCASQEDAWLTIC